MRVEDLDFELPVNLLATQPREYRGEQRHDSRLLVMHRKSQEIEFRRFWDIGDYLGDGDLVVLNRSQTVNASIFGNVEGMGRLEFQLSANRDGTTWWCTCNPWREPTPGAVITFSDGVFGKVIGRTEAMALWIIEFGGTDDLPAFLERAGRPILSPYVDRVYSNADYNCVYADTPGSSEMPAAGRHFTPELLDHLRGRGVETAFITLHTGMSSVAIKADHFEDHKMHEEWYSIDTDAAEAINEAKARGSLVLVVGTTVMRTLETVARQSGTVQAAEGWTDLYIYPGFDFRVADAFVTNFHGSRSSRIALAAAFTGPDLLRKAYDYAIENELLFYEFGDTTLTLPD